jgi:uncharacterized phage protein (TIGR02216 family)
MAAGLGLLGLSPAAFWAMTPRELAAGLRGRSGPRPEAPPRKDDMQALMQRFPD